MKIYNTLSKRKEEFVPLEEGKVKMYVCGPTVYNFIHIGNARPMIAFDTVRRYFEYKGFEVNFVSNFTAVAATLNNIGPGLGAVGPTCNFGGFSILSKLVLMFDMLAGRLELFPMLLLFSPSTWKKI